MALDDGIGLELPIQAKAPDGTIHWRGNGFPGGVKKCVNGHATVTILKGWAVALGTGSTYGYILPNGATVAKKQALKVVPANSGSAASAVLFGVALSTAAPGEMLNVAVAGSVVPVKSKASGSLANNAVRAFVIATTSNGVVDTTNTAPTAPVMQLGRVVTAAGTTGGTTDSGVDTEVVILVGPA